jgi:hemerythrin
MILNCFIAEGAMASRLWTSDLTIGNDAQDAEHRKLVSLIDMVIASVNCRADTSATVHQLANLIACVQPHFAEEEAMMLEWECVSLASHAAEHRRRLQQLRNLLLKVESAEAVSQLSMHYFMREWLRQHILTFDMQMCEALMVPRGNSGRRTYLWL